MQGARLTALELAAAGLDVTLLCDNMAASSDGPGRVQAVFVGCDRVSANGDACNKSAPWALPSWPVTMASLSMSAPHPTVDLSLEQGSQIPIEQRQEAR